MQQLVEEAIDAILRADAASRHATFEVLASLVDDGELSIEAAIGLQAALRGVVEVDLTVNPAIQGRALRKLDPP